jgi:hypothetical protein
MSTNAPELWFKSEVCGILPAIAGIFVAWLAHPLVVEISF